MSASYTVSISGDNNDTDLVISSQNGAINSDKSNDRLTMDHSHNIIDSSFAIAVARIDNSNAKDKLISFKVHNPETSHVVFKELAEYPIVKTYKTNPIFGSASVNMQDGFNAVSRAMSSVLAFPVMEVEHGYNADLQGVALLEGPDGTNRYDSACVIVPNASKSSILMLEHFAKTPNKQFFGLCTSLTSRLHTPPSTDSLFDPLSYKQQIRVQLKDGFVHDNQNSIALSAVFAMEGSPSYVDLADDPYVVAFHSAAKELGSKVIHMEYLTDFSSTATSFDDLITYFESVAFRTELGDLSNGPVFVAIYLPWSMQTYSYPDENIKYVCDAIGKIDNLDISRVIINHTWINAMPLGQAYIDRGLTENNYINSWNDFPLGVGKFISPIRLDFGESHDSENLVLKELVSAGVESISPALIVGVLNNLIISLALDNNRREPTGESLAQYVSANSFTKTQIKKLVGEGVSIKTIIKPGLHFEDTDMYVIDMKSLNDSYNLAKQRIVSKLNDAVTMNLYNLVSRVKTIEQSSDLVATHENSYDKMTIYTLTQKGADRWALYTDLYEAAGSPSALTKGREYDFRLAPFGPKHLALLNGYITQEGTTAADHVTIHGNSILQQVQDQGYCTTAIEPASTWTRLTSSDFVFCAEFEYPGHDPFNVLRADGNDMKFKYYEKDYCGQFGGAYSKTAYKNYALRFKYKFDASDRCIYRIPPFTKNYAYLNSGFEFGVQQDPTNTQHKFLKWAFYELSIRANEKDPFKIFQIAPEGIDIIPYVGFAVNQVYEPTTDLEHADTTEVEIEFRSYGNAIQIKVNGETLSYNTINPRAGFVVDNSYGSTSNLAYDQGHFGFQSEGDSIKFSDMYIIKLNSIDDTLPTEPRADAEPDLDSLVGKFAVNAMVKYVTRIVKVGNAYHFQFWKLTKIADGEWETKVLPLLESGSLSVADLETFGFKEIDAPIANVYENEEGIKFSVPKSTSISAEDSVKEASFGRIVWNLSQTTAYHYDDTFYFNYTNIDNKKDAYINNGGISEDHFNSLKTMNDNGGLVKPWPAYYMKTLGLPNFQWVIY